MRRLAREQLAILNEDVIEDLKQFITATVSQAFTHTASKDDIANMATKHDIVELRHEMQDGFAETRAAVAETISTVNGAVDERFDNHDKRLKRLERRAVTT